MLRAFATKLNVFRGAAAAIFLAGIELWFYVQVCWFRGNFRLQTLADLLLFFWFLGGILVYVREQERAWAGNVAEQEWS